MAADIYARGRLYCLNELVKILKEIVDKKDSINTEEIISMLINHVSTEMAATMTEFSEVARQSDDYSTEQKEKVEEIIEKHEAIQQKTGLNPDAKTAPEPKAEPEAEAKVETAAPPQKDEAIIPKPSAKQQVDEHSKSVDDLLKDLESLRNL